MAVTLAKLVADCRNIASSGPTSIDFRISDEQIAFWIHEQRSMLISQALQKTYDISDNWIQQLRCVDLEEVDSAECCEVESGCTVLRTVSEIPEAVELNGNDLILSVTGIDGTPLFRTNFFRSRFVNGAKYTKNKAFWYMKNSRIYIVNTNLIEKITINAVFEDPTDLATFNTCEGVACYTDDSPYPITMKMASQITDIIIQTKVRPFMLSSQDTNNNSKDETLPLGK